MSRIVKSSVWEGGWIVLEANVLGRSILTIRHPDDGSPDGLRDTHIPMYEDDLKTLLKALNEVYREAVKERKARKLREKIENGDTEEVYEDTMYSAPHHSQGQSVSDQIAAALARKRVWKKTRKRK